MTPNGTPDAPPLSADHPYERNGRQAVIRYTPEDQAWNIFTPDGVYVASFTRTPDARGYQLDSTRTGPTGEHLVIADMNWSALVSQALAAAEGYEA